MRSAQLTTRAGGDPYLLLTYREIVEAMTAYFIERCQALDNPKDERAAGRMDELAEASAFLARVSRAEARYDLTELSQHLVRIQA